MEKLDQIDRIYLNMVATWYETQDAQLLPDIEQWELNRATAYDKLDIFPYYLKTDKAPKVEVNV